MVDNSDAISIRINDSPGGGGTIGGYTPKKDGISGLKSSVIAPSPAGSAVSYNRVGTSSATSVNYEAEEEPYNPKRMSCCERFRLEMECKNMDFDVWTSLGRLEWADAFGRGGSGCGCRCMRITPLGPGPMRIVRLLFLLIVTGINVPSAILDWEDGFWAMQFTHWINVTANIYLLLGTFLCFWLHKHDYIPVTITILGKFTWYAHITAVPTVVGISLGFWLTNLFFADLNPTLIDALAHGVVAVVLILDLYVGAQPYFLPQIIYGQILTTSWLFWSIIHYVLKLGPVHDDGGIYIYPFINWANPGLTMLYAVAILAWITLVHVVIWLISRSRDVPFKHYEKTLRF